MISRPPPPRGYKYNSVNGKLEKKTKKLKIVGRHNKKRKRRRGGNLASVVPHARKILNLMKKLRLIK